MSIQRMVTIKSKPGLFLHQAVTAAVMKVLYSTGSRLFESNPPEKSLQWLLVREENLGSKSEVAISVHFDLGLNPNSYDTINQRSDQLAAAIADQLALLANLWPIESVAVEVTSSHQAWGHASTMATNEC